MVGRKKISILVTIILIVSLLSGCTKSAASKKSLKDEKKIKIGITQIVEHPALDAARKGFLDCLKDKGYVDGDKIEVDFQSAQGEIANCQTIANKFVSDKKHLILAISTNSAQAVYNATKDIPILITAVTDPVKASLVKSLEKPGTNVTGTSDKGPIEKQFNLLKDIIKDVKTVGVIYNTSESNSEIQVKEAKAVCDKLGIKLIEVGITNVNEIPQALDSIIPKIDSLYIPTDNTVAPSMPLITNKCYSKKIPIIGAEKAHVEGGALATVGIDYYKLGYETGLSALEIIEGKDPSSIPISTQKEMELVINTDACKKLNITIPSELLKNAKTVQGGIK